MSTYFHKCNPRSYRTELRPENMQEARRKKLIPFKMLFFERLYLPCSVQDTTVRNIYESLIFTEPYVNPQRPEMESSLPPPLTDQAQNHLTSPAPSPVLSPQGSSFLHRWRRVDGNAREKKKEKQKCIAIVFLHFPLVSPSIPLRFIKCISANPKTIFCNRSLRLKSWPTDES